MLNSKIGLSNTVCVLFLGIFCVLCLKKTDALEGIHLNEWCMFVSSSNLNYVVPLGKSQCIL